MGQQLLSIWISGPSRSGKTTRLIEEFRDWISKQKSKAKQIVSSSVLVFAANGDNRRQLSDRLTKAVDGSYPVVCKTPNGFIVDEVKLFWPVLFENLGLKAQFPVRLRPETEQELATSLWRSHLTQQDIAQFGNEYTFVRRVLDLLQLAGASEIPLEDIPDILARGLPNNFLAEDTEESWPKIGKLLLDWREWCLARGLLSYGIMYELYWRYLLPNPTYQYHLTRRYEAIFADDTDDYPAIARDLCEFLLSKNIRGVFTYNLEGKIRLGLNGDPDYLAGLSSHCRVESLDRRDNKSLQYLSDSVVQLILDPPYVANLPDCIESIQTISRAQMLRQTAEVIIKAIASKQVKPQDIAVIAPGLDEIARYTLMEILSAAGIPVEPINEQRPLISNPIVRALLTLLALIYPGLGRSLDRDSIAEMLTILSCKQREDRNNTLVSDIDPVRAGLLADRCYVPDLERPYLTSAIESFPRWDRLGHRASVAYKDILSWLETTKEQQAERVFTNPTAVLDRAIKYFFKNGKHLSCDRLSALRELIETAQHFWQVDRRIRQNEPSSLSETVTVAQFIQLLRRGTITANPRPLSSLGIESDRPAAVTLANIFQYRSRRSCHRWHFWLDAGSSLWDKAGSAALFAYPLFLRERSDREWMPEDEVKEDEERIDRILRDLLARAEEKVFLCYSDLGVNGKEQMGPLFSLVNASEQFSLNSLHSKAEEQS